MATNDELKYKKFFAEQRLWALELNLIPQIYELKKIVASMETSLNSAQLDLKRAIQELEDSNKEEDNEHA